MMAHSIDQRIRMKAYEIWLREGCPEGSDARHWEMARKFVAGEEVKSTLTSRFFDVHDMNADATEPGDEATSSGTSPPRTRKAQMH